MTRIFNESTNILSTLLCWLPGCNSQYVGTYAAGCGPRPPPCNPAPQCPPPPPQPICPPPIPQQICPPKPPPCPLPPPCPPQYCPPPPICPPPPPPPPPPACPPPPPPSLQACPPPALPPLPVPCKCPPPPPQIPCNCPSPPSPPPPCDSPPVPIRPHRKPELYTTYPESFIDSMPLETQPDSYVTHPDMYVRQPHNPLPSSIPKSPHNYVRPSIAQNDCCCRCVSPCKFRRQKLNLFGVKNKPVDPLCNNQEMKRIIEKYITSNLTDSKRNIQRAAEDHFDTNINVICGTGAFSYVVHTKEFCQHTIDNKTCYVFQPTP
uniref:Ground-like domain-containing protein n=1 Tax=Syphacia muris TaxID=451379 RepID=A0A0N5AHT7_9BILA